MVMPRMLPWKEDGARRVESDRRGSMRRRKFFPGPVLDIHSETQ